MRAALPTEYPAPVVLQHDQQGDPGQQRTAVRGQGFRREQKHTQRLVNTCPPQYAPYVEPSEWTNKARHLEARLEFAPLPLTLLAKATAWDNIANPFRPMPPVGGLPQLHCIEPEEHDVSLPLGKLVGHSIVLGTNRVSKTCLAELFITKDIHRKRRGQHEVMIIFDPKGDADLLKDMYVECERARRCAARWPASWMPRSP